jgi:hypothetical protein
MAPANILVFNLLIVRVKPWSSLPTTASWALLRITTEQVLTHQKLWILAVWAVTQSFCVAALRRAAARAACSRRY